MFPQVAAPGDEDDEDDEDFVEVPEKEGYEACVPELLRPPCGEQPSCTGRGSLSGPCPSGRDLTSSLGPSRPGAGCGGRSCLCQVGPGSPRPGLAAAQSSCPRKPHVLSEAALPGSHCPLAGGPSRSSRGRSQAVPVGQGPGRPLPGYRPVPSPHPAAAAHPGRGAALCAVTEVSVLG